MLLQGKDKKNFKTKIFKNMPLTFQQSTSLRIQLEILLTNNNERRHEMTLITKNLSLSSVWRNSTLETLVYLFS